MSGHSHWANIAHKKGTVDAKRGRLWSKLSRAIMVAAQNGGGDPDMNLKLRYAIDKARKVSMPKDNIERAVKKGTGETGGVNFEEITYEGYGPGGVAILVEILTDNRNRTASEIRKIFERGGGNLGSSGCVSYLFERKGLMFIPVTSSDEDTLMSIALEAGADDLKRMDSIYEVVCDPTVFAAVKEALEKAGLKPDNAEVSLIGKVPVDADVETGQRIMKLVDALDEHDDVQNVYTNLNVTEAMVAGL